jgi:hypothetical protein
MPTPTKQRDELRSKSITLLLTLMAIVTVTTSARAQVFYQYPTALPVEMMRITVGPYLAAGDNSLYRMSGFARWGLADQLDIGAELIGESRDSHGRFGAGIDMKFSLLPTIRSMPFDLSADVGVGFINSDELSTLQIPIGGIVSIPLEMESGRSIVPYMGVYLLIVEDKIDTGSGKVSDTDFDAEIRGGLSVGITPDADGFATLQLGRDGLFALGVVMRL